MLILYRVCLLLALHCPLAAVANQKKIDAVLRSVEQYCGACHAAPSPEILPKSSWPFVIDTMAKLAKKRMGREFIPPETLRDITALYYGSSPAKLPHLPVYLSDNSNQFSISDVGDLSSRPAITHIQPVQFSQNSEYQLLVCDAEMNQVLLLTKKDGSWQEEVLAEAEIPVRTQVIDYDGDGDKDIIVAVLGQFPPSGVLVGKVLLLRQTGVGKFQKEVLLSNVGRVTDTRAVDIDNDGDLDLVVSVFGGGAIGEILWLENLGDNKYQRHRILNYSGALNVSPYDLNNDGHIDIISLLSQEHEIVVAMMNLGNGQFQKKVIYKAPHPMYGSTSMSPYDIDNDGDMDILFTNGDAHDLQVEPKPYHGVQWLENQGGLKFKFHDIGRFYGAATAVAVDFDGDGDIDIVAGSWLNYWEDERRQSLIWYENNGKQQFARRNISNSPPGVVSLAAAEIADISDGKSSDIFVGVFRMDLFDIKGKKDEANKKQIKNNVIDNSRILLVQKKLKDN